MKIYKKVFQPFGFSGINLPPLLFFLPPLYTLSGDSEGDQGAGFDSPAFVKLCSSHTEGGRDQRFSLQILLGSGRGC